MYYVRKASIDGTASIGPQVPRISVIPGGQMKLKILRRRRTCQSRCQRKFLFQCDCSYYYPCPPPSSSACPSRSPSACPSRTPSACPSRSFPSRSPFSFDAVITMQTACLFIHAGLATLRNDVTSTPCTSCARTWPGLPCPCGIKRRRMEVCDIRHSDLADFIAFGEHVMLFSFQLPRHIPLSG